MSAFAPRFGTDGIRGRANTELSADLALRIGLAAGDVIQDGTKHPLVLVGRDTRISGDVLEAALSAGLAARGCQVCLIGVAPTPAVSYLVGKCGAAAGAVISASHNPFHDNGIKFFGADGKKLPDAMEREIESRLERMASDALPSGEDVGRIAADPALLLSYADHVAKLAAHTLDGLRIVMDCANGATSALAPLIYERLGATVHAIHTTPDGVNINAGCGSTHPEALCEHVRRTGADAGVAFDGDGDRVMLCDTHGTVVDGDRMLLICAHGMKRRGELLGDVVVATIMSNAGLEVALERIGARLLRTDVGDRHVAAELERVGGSLGGEQSGHLLFPRLGATGDGMVTGLRVLGEVREAASSLTELAGQMQAYAQRLRSVRVRDRNGWRDDPEILQAIERARSRLGKPEWLSVRASGTEPLVRVMAQDEDEALVNSVVEELCDLIAQRFGI